MLVLARPPAFSFAARYGLRQWLKGSLWVVPLLGGLAGLALAQLDPWIESTWPARGGWRYSADTASDILTAIVGAMVGLFGFVVTISVLVVQMATETLSPRFMRLWYRDRLQKLVLACFIGTVTFAFALHRSVATTACRASVSRWPGSRSGSASSSCCSISTASPTTCAQSEWRSWSRVGGCVRSTRSPGPAARRASASPAGRIRFRETRRRCSSAGWTPEPSRRSTCTDCSPRRCGTTARSS